MVNKDIFMLCESIPNEQELSKYANNLNYKANIKYDGERVMACKNGEEIILFNRRGNIVTRKFREVVNSLKAIKRDFIIDGEIISFDNDFNKLQRRALTKDLKKIEFLEKEIPCKYMVFDILFCDNKIVMKEPLQNRVAILRELFQDSEYLKMCVYDDINNLLAIAKESNSEGIIVKDMNSVYESKRSRSWLKYKLFKETTITITGFTDNPKGIRATDDKGNAIQIAGYHATEVKAVMERQGYATIQIQYLAKTKEGKLRFPSFRGLVEKEV